MAHNRSLYNKFTQICRVDFLWTEIEKTLAYINRDYFLGMEEIMMHYDWDDERSYSEPFMSADYVRGRG